jgi:lipopolysaccharide/colanic/teichoic acid biosynthesis glycosyltransferase
LTYPSTSSAAMKRLIDIAASALGLLLLSPLLLLIVAWIILDSPGGAFFFQTRVGKNLKPFSMVKFRSMVKDAPKLGAEYTVDGDPRITRAGRFLRHTSLDELPQLWNVLVGEMSLVGPRPYTPSQQTQYTDAFWHERHLVKPGITGLAQVSGRSNLTYEAQIHYDLTYVRTHTILMDFAIILQTILVVVKRQGVN